MKDSRGGGSDGKTCSLPNGIRTGPVTNDVVADSRDQPHKRAHSTNAGTVTTTHGLPTRIARNTRAGPVPSICEAAQPPRPLTMNSTRGETPCAPSTGNFSADSLTCGLRSRGSLVIPEIHNSMIFMANEECP